MYVKGALLMISLTSIDTVLKSDRTKTSDCKKKGASTLHAPL